MRFVLPALFVLAACSDAGAPDVLPVAFQVTAGADQIAAAATELPQAVEVRVMDASAGPVPNYPINWAALDGGTAHSTVVYSGTDGIARQRWTLGSQAWEGNDPAYGRKRQRLIARALHPETGAVLVDDTVWATARPDVATHVWLESIGIMLATRDSGGMSVVFQDASNNWLAPCPGAGSWENLTWWSTDSSIAVPTGQTFWGGVLPDGDRMLYAWVRGIDTGTTTIGITAACGPFMATSRVTVFP